MYTYVICHQHLTQRWCREKRFAIVRWNFWFGMVMYRCLWMWWLFWNQFKPDNHAAPSQSSHLNISKLPFVSNQCTVQNLFKMMLYLMLKWFQLQPNNAHLEMFTKFGCQSKSENFKAIIGQSQIVIHPLFARVQQGNVNFASDWFSILLRVQDIY